MFIDEITINPSSSGPDIRASVNSNQEASDKVKPDSAGSIGDRHCELVELSESPFNFPGLIISTLPLIQSPKISVILMLRCPSLKNA